MTLRRMQVTDLRCLHQAELELDPQFTLISGPNASGKTSVLEAIYVLGRGRSFRTRRVDRLIRTGAERFVIFGETEVAARRVAMGVEGSKDGVRAKLAGEQLNSLAELASALPVQIIDPEVHRLIEEGPSRRRRFLDWGVFHVEPTFIGHWQKYRQVLKQRNAALRSGQSAGPATLWDNELIRYGQLLTDARQRYAALLEPAAKSVARSLLGLELRLSYRTGWGAEVSFAEALERSRRQEQEQGVTLVGPQRAELSIRLDGLAARDRVSRGQQKLLAAVLLIAQIKLFPVESPVRPTLLLDDPAAELDVEHLSLLIQEVRSQALQLVVTTLHGDIAELSAFGVPGRRFRLERGALIEAA